MISLRKSLAASAALALTAAIALAAPAANASPTTGNLTRAAGPNDPAYWIDS